MTAAMPDDVREEWVDKYNAAGAYPKALLRLIIADGYLGTAGDVDKRRMTILHAEHILRLVARSGVGKPGREYLVRLLRWHYGYTSGGPPVPSHARLDAGAAAFIRRRAHELVTAHEHGDVGPVIDLVNNREAT